MKHKINTLSILLVLVVMLALFTIGAQLACADKGAPPGVTVVDLADKGDENTDIRQLSEDEKVKVLNICYQYLFL